MKIAIIFILWTAFGLLSLTHFFFGKTAASGAELRDLASHILPFYWAWALVTPAVLASARHLAPRARRGASAVFMWWTQAAGAAIAIMLTHGAIYLGAVRLFGVEPETRFDVRTFGDYALRHGGGDVATYAVIVGVILLVDARRRVRERELAASILEARLARADAELLRWQLQPHFLFNTLNTVSSLVLKGETQPADRAIGLIARWLRAALSQRGDLVVTLADELATVEQYVAIEVLRFGDALRLELHVDDDALRTEMPSLLVQPLVENAIRHGVGTDDDSRPIVITAIVRDARMTLTVRNRGSLDAAPGAASADGAGSGFGLRYVRERIGHFYGKDASLDVSTDGHDVVAVLDIPLHVLAGIAA